ncbi:MAG: PEP-CTERM sorting domain-containing protein [Planctomycetes bacterium]|nr:PEP-CTERM sorting domain-containing protein [Planctomycetota bacterium]MBU4400253.1 PEP-CTERM sorting domain-containing protein [Planctomycetota bacterium]MCG2684823.1 PEP-CTERM sorting domain-containing protein [Planctomycetales bacterium]
MSYSVGGVVKEIVLWSSGGVLTEGGNYAKFINLAPDGSNQIVISAIATGTPGVLDIITFNGLQLVAVPEPSTVVLLVTGLIGLLCYAWRKRR